MAIDNLITDHLDLWTAALRPKSSAGRGSNSKLELTGIKKLRELILELAVRGKLVPQDPSDEPASVLLERIAAEKAQLVKEGKIKKPKALPEIGGQDKPFELPEGWEWACIGYVGNIFNGNSVNAKVKEEKYTCITEGYPFIATKDVGYGFDKLDYENGVTIPFDEANFKVAHKNAVLICAEGGSAGKKCGITDQDICFGNKLFAIELFSNFEPKLLLATYLTPTFFSNFSAVMTGIIGGISVNKFSELLIPISPLAEQHRIVAKVDELMALCDQLELRSESQLAAHQTLVETLLTTLTDSADADELSQNWARLSTHFDTLFTTEASIDALKQTILQLAVMGKLVPQDPSDEPASALLERIAAEKARLVKEKKIKKEKPLPEISENEKPFELPQGWAWSRISESSLFCEYGSSEKTVSELSDGVPVLKMGDIQEGNIVLGCHQVVSPKIDDLPNLYLKKGDVLYNRTNSAELVGKTGMFDGDDDTYTFASYLIRIRCSIHNIRPEYLTLCMNSPLFRKTQIEPHIKQQCGQANVNGTLMKSMLVSIPPYHEQVLILQKIHELMTLCDQLKSRLQTSQQTQLALAESLVEGALEDSI